MLVLSLKPLNSKEANWNGQAGRQDHVLSQVDALTKNSDLAKFCCKNIVQKE